jgi:hypothetical protein
MLRDLLRSLVATSFTKQGLRDWMGREDDAPFESLAANDLIEPASDNVSCSLIVGVDERFGECELWTMSVAGVSIAKARIGKPIARAAAQVLLDGVVRRAVELNDVPNALYSIETIELFGSFNRPGAEPVGDVDLRVLCTRRAPGERHGPLGGELDAAMAAYRRVRRLLTAGSPRIDLQLDEGVLRPLPDGADPALVFVRSSSAHTLTPPAGRSSTR